HYDRLSSLLDLSVSQSGRLMPLHSADDFRPSCAHHRAPPLLSGRRPPPSNYPPCAVPDTVMPRLDTYDDKGGRSSRRSTKAGALASKPTPYPAHADTSARAKL